MNLELAARINSFLAALVLLTAFAMLAQRRLNGLIHLFAWQGLLLSVNTAIVGFVASRHHLYISSVLPLGLKVVLLPYILHVLIRRLRIHKEIEVVVNIPATMLIGIKRLEVIQRVHPSELAVTGNGPITPGATSARKRRLVCTMCSS